MKLSAYGIDIDLPPGWEGRLYQRLGGFPILHASNFALPPEDGDFGSRAVSTMDGRGVFVGLVEYDSVLAGSGLFTASGLPLPLRGSEASPKALQRMLPARGGIQRFLTQSGRAFCLYVVVPTGVSRDRLVQEVNRVLSTLNIDPRNGA
jgi:hypothetical protein